MNADDDELQRLIGLIYEAAIDTDLLPELLENMSSMVAPDAESGEISMLEPSTTSAKSSALLEDHFQRAWRMNQKISQLHDGLAASTAVLDRMPLGLVFVEKDGEIKFANWRASIILDGSFGISRLHGRLHASSPSKTRELHRLINAALADTSLPNSSINLSEPVAVSLTVSPLKSHPTAEGKPLALVLIATPDASSHLSERDLQRKFRLTSSEAALALALINSGDLDKAARTLSISKHTARSHLKAIFAKTGANKQTQLIRDILTSPEAIIANSSIAALKPVITNIPWYALPMHERHIRLTDGHKLGFAEYGDPSGIPVIICHGAAASRLQTHPDDSIAARAGVRLIVPDRPGHGISDFQQQRTLLDWPDTLVELADRLNIKQFALIGLTAGGGPYALHCAYRIPHRLTAVALVSARATPQLMQVAPVVKGVLGLARHAPILLNQYMNFMGKALMSDPEVYFRQRLSHCSEVEQNFLNTPLGKKVFSMPFAEAKRDGTRGIAWDLTLCMRDWEFDLGEIKHPITMWHGANDSVISRQEAENIAAALPDCSTRFIDAEGQYLYINHWQAILDDIIQRHANAH